MSRPTTPWTSRDAIKVAKGIRRAKQFLEATSEFIADEEMSSAASDLFFGWRRKRPVAAMVQLFDALARDERFGDDPDLGLLVIVPLDRVQSIAPSRPSLAELMQHRWRKDAIPAVHIGRKRAFDAFDNAQELREPVAWTSSGLLASAYLRTWASEESAADGEFETALYLRYFSDEAEPVQGDFGLPPIG